MFAALQQPTSRLNHKLNRGIESFIPPEPKSKVAEPATGTDWLSLSGLSQRDRIGGAGCVEKYHRRAVPIANLHTEDIPVEGQRPLQVTDSDMDMRQTVAVYHMDDRDSLSLPY